MLHDVLERADLQVHTAGLLQAVTKDLLEWRQLPLLGLDLDAVEPASLHSYSVRNPLRGAEALQNREMKDALEVEVILDL
jgi:hypothetical protein